MVFNAFICNYFLFRCNFASVNTVRSVMNWNSVTAVAGQSAEHGSRRQIIATYPGGLSATANVTLPGAMRDVLYDGRSVPFFRRRSNRRGHGRITTKNLFRCSR